MCLGKAHPKARSIIYEVMERGSPDVISKDMIGKPLDKHMFTRIDCDANTSNICGKLLSISSFMSQIAAIIQLRTERAIDGKRAVTKIMEEMSVLDPTQLWNKLQQSGYQCLFELT